MAKAVSFDEDEVEPITGNPDAGDGDSAAARRALGAMNPSAWIDQPEAFVNGAVEGYNRNKSVGPNAPTVGDDSAQARQPNYSAAGQAVGAVVGGVNTLVNSPQTLVKHVIPEALGGDSGHAANELLKPGYADKQLMHPDATPSASGGQVVLDKPNEQDLLPADPEVQAAKDYLKRFGGSQNSDMGAVPMEKQAAGDVEDAADEKKHAISAGADADIALNKASQPALEDLSKETQSNYAAGKQNMAQADTEAHDYQTSAAAAYDDYVKRADSLTPDHYWNSLSTPQKILTGISLVLSGGGAGVLHQGMGGAQQRFQDSIQRDTADQLAQVEARKGKAEGLQGLAKIAMDRFRNSGDAMAWLNNQKAQQTAAQLKFMASKYADPKIRASAEAAAADVSAWGLEQQQKRIEMNNKAQVQATEARRNNAEAARAYQMGAMEPLKMGLDVTKLEAERNAGVMRGPDQKPVMGPDGRPMIMPVAQAHEFNTKMAGYNSALSGLQKAVEAGKSSGWGSFTANGAYNAAVVAALSGLPPAEMEAILKAVPGPNSPAEAEPALHAIEQQIQSRQRDMVGSVGGPRSAPNLGGTRE